VTNYRRGIYRSTAWMLFNDLFPMAINNTERMVWSCSPCYDNVRGPDPLVVLSHFLDGSGCDMYLMPGNHRVISYSTVYRSKSRPEAYKPLVEKNLYCATATLRCQH